MFFSLVDDSVKFIIEELRKYYAQGAPYDTFGDLIPVEIRFSADPNTTKITITDEHPDQDRFLPAIVVTGQSGPSKEVGFGQRGRIVEKVIDTETRFFEQFTGNANLTITFAVVAKSVPQRAIITDRMIVGFANKRLLRTNLEKREVIVTPEFVRLNGMSEQPFGANIQKVYRSDLSIDVWATWVEEIELTGDILETLKIDKQPV